MTRKLHELFDGTRLRVGTRRTPLAIAQTRRVVASIKESFPWVDVEIVGIETSADLWTGDLSALGGKGSWTKELDRALVYGQIDLAVHSMKDVPGDVPLPDGTRFGAYLPRGDVHDVVISWDGRKLADLPAGSKIGTSSVRRRAQLSLYRPDLLIEPARGNIGTRIQKLDAGEYDAILLARSGLHRLNLEYRITEVLPTAWTGGDSVAIVPAVGAAVVGVQARIADEPVIRILEEINDADSARHILAERTMLRMLHGHCHSPIAGYAHTTPDGQISLFGMVFNHDGTQWVRSHGWGPAEKLASVGAWVAGDLHRQGARPLITATMTTRSDRL